MLALLEEAQHADLIGLADDPLLRGGVELAEFGDGKGGLRVRGRAPQRRIRCPPPERERRGQEHAGVAAAGDDDGRGRDRGFGEHCAGGHAVGHVADLQAGVAAFRREPQIDPGKLGGLVQHKGLGQRVHPDGGDGVHLPQGVDRKLPLPDEDRRGPRAALARKGYGLGPGGDVGRDAERTVQRTVAVRGAGNGQRDAVERGQELFARAEPFNVVGYVDFPQVFQLGGRGAHRFGRRRGLAVHHDVEIAVAGDVEPLGDGAGPVGLGFGPAVQGGVQARAPGERVKGHVRGYLHGAGAQGLGQQGGRRPRVGRGRGHVVGQGRCRGFDGQGQDAIDHGGGLGKPLIAHVVVQQRVDEDARPCPGLAGEHVGLEALPGDFLLHRVDAAVDGFDFREGDHAHAVGAHAAGVAPCLGDGGDGQERRGQAGAARVAFRGHALQPDELPFLDQRQPVEAGQGLPVGDKDGGAAGRAFNAEAVGVQPLGFGAGHDRRHRSRLSPGGGARCPWGTSPRCRRSFVVRPRRVDGITLTALDDVDLRRCPAGRRRPRSSCRGPC